jgi:hypothetical protein
MKLIQNLALSVAAVVLVAGSPARAQDKGTVGVSMPTKSSARWISDGDSMVKSLKEKGYKADLQYAEDDIPNQLAQVENMITKKVKVMMTDPARKRRTDPGNPEVCPVFSYHQLYSPAETIEMVNRECRTAGIGCTDCKSWMSQNMIRELSPVLSRRKEYENRRGEIQDILAEGN